MIKIRMALLAMTSVILSVPVARAAVGDLIWERRDSSWESNLAQDVFVTSDGSIYAIGHAEQNSVEAKAWIMKLDPNGTLLWERFYQGPLLGTRGFGIVVSPDGTVYGIGRDHDDLSWSASTMWVKAWDSDGNLLWSQDYQYPGATLTHGWSIGFDWGAGLLLTSGNSESGGGNAFLQTRDPTTGVIINQKDLPGCGDSGGALSADIYASMGVAANHEGGLYWTVPCSSGTDIFRTDRNLNISWSSYESANVGPFILPNGNTLYSGWGSHWGFSEGCPGASRSDLVLLDEDSGQVVSGGPVTNILAGYYDENIHLRDVVADYDGRLFVTGADMTLSGAYDLWVAQLNPDGTTVWARTFPTNSGGCYEDIGLGIALDAFGNLIIAGRAWWDGFWVLKIAGPPPAATPTPTPTGLPGTATFTPTPTSTITPTPTIAPNLVGPIAFVTGREGTGSASGLEIYAMNPDGSSPINLTNNGCIDIYPDWAKDGTEIVRKSCGGDSNIVIMDSNGANNTPVTIGTTAAPQEPAFSPDGTQIVWRRTAFFTPSELGLWKVNRDGTGLTQLTSITPKYDWQAAWSPDGTKIAFSSNRNSPDPSGSFGHEDIYIMNSDGSGMQQLTFTGDTNSGRNRFPAWSPDSSKIAFSSDRDGNYEIYVMNADGTNLTRLTFDPGSDSDPFFSGDGSQIVFESDRDGNKEIYVMNSDGSGQTNISNNPSDDYQPSWRWASPWTPPTLTSTLTISNTATTTPSTTLTPTISPTMTVSLSETISATYTNSATASPTPSVSVTPEWDAWDPTDDSGLSATVLVPTTSDQAHGPHTLSPDDTADFYLIDMKSDRIYYFYSTYSSGAAVPGGAGDVQGRLAFNPEGTLIATSDNDSGGNYQFSFSYSPNTDGTFYLKVWTVGMANSWDGDIHYYYIQKTPTPTVTSTVSMTFTPTPTMTVTPSSTPTKSVSLTHTLSYSTTFSPTPSWTLTPTEIPTLTPTPTISTTFTAVPTWTHSLTFTPTPLSAPEGEVAWVISSSGSMPFNTAAGEWISICGDFGTGSSIAIEIYNLAWDKVKTVYVGIASGGVSCWDWYGTNDLGDYVSSGTYVISVIEEGAWSETINVTLVR